MIADRKFVTRNNPDNQKRLQYLVKTEWASRSVEKTRGLRWEGEKKMKGIEGMQAGMALDGVDVNDKMLTDEGADDMMGFDFDGARAEVDAGDKKRMASNAGSRKSKRKLGDGSESDSDESDSESDSQNARSKAKSKGGRGYAKNVIDVDKLAKKKTYNEKDLINAEEHHVINIEVANKFAVCAKDAMGNLSLDCDKQINYGKGNKHVSTSLRKDLADFKLKAERVRTELLEMLSGSSKAGYDRC